MASPRTTPRGGDTDYNLLWKIALSVSEGGGAATWDELTGKPTEFPPEAHTHPQSDVTGLVSALAGKAATVHTHAISDVTNLQTTLDGKASKQRYNTLFIPAGAMTPATTSGAAAATKEATTNKQNYDVFAFDGASTESVWFVVRMPDIWDLGTLKAVFHWAPDTGGSGAVVWGLCSVAVSNDDAIDVAPGTEVTVADSVIAVGDLHTTSATSAMTVGGTPAAGDVVFFKVRRIPSDAGDTMTQDALLLGLTLQWRESATEASAW